MSDWRSTWGFGDGGERLAFDALRADGWALVNTAEASADGAPMLALLSGQYILPDLLGFRDGTAAWFEVKSKTDAIEYRKAGELRHGFEKRCYEAYRDVAAITEVPVYLLIYERRTKTLLQGRLADLSPIDETDDEQATRDYDGERIVYFTRDDFPQQVEATRFDGRTYIRETALDELRQPVFNNRETLDSWAVATAGGAADAE